MKKQLCKLLALALVLGLMLPLLPVQAAAAGYQVTVKKTGIRADSVVNEEGYGSLSLEAVFDDGDSGLLGGGDMPPTYALINSDGEIVFNYREFPCGYSLSNGLFVNGIVTEQYGNDSYGVYSLFDLNGNQVIDQTYDYLNFYNGYGVAITSATVGVIPTREVIDSNGNVVMTLPEGFNLELMGGWGAWMFETKSWGMSYIGNVGGYGDGLMWVYTGLDIESNISEAADLEWADQQYGSIHDQMTWFGGPYCGYMDLEGNMVIPLQYYSVYPFVDGLAAVQEYAEPDVPIEDLPWDADLGGDWIYINKSGQNAFGRSFSLASSFSGGYAYVANDQGKYGYIDKSGQDVIPMVYDDAFGAGDGTYFSVGINSGDTTLYGLVDKNNQVVVPLEYDDITSYHHGVAYGIKDGEVYVITIEEEAENPFTDLQPGAFYIDAVDWALENSITGGVSATEFGPLQSCTRAQVVTFLWRAEGCPAPTSTSTAFTDVQPGQFYYDAVLWAAEQGITGGVSETEFGTMQNVTRGQFVTFLWRAKGKPAPTGGNAFSDVDPNQFYYDAVLWAAEKGVTGGVSATEFGPLQSCTRGQVVTFLYRAYV